MFGVLFWISFLFVFYVYFGYPFLIWILSRTKPEESISSIISEDELPTVTLMICTYKEEAVIERKLKNSLALKYPKEKFDILVVNDGCLDRTAELVRQFSNQGVRLSQSDERGGKTSAISRGMQLTNSKIVVFSDANNDFKPDAILELVKYFNDPSVGMVSGARVLYDEERGLSYSEGAYWKYESFIKKCESRFNSCTSSPGEINAILRTAFTPPPEGIINDDSFMTLSIVHNGYSIKYEPKAQSYEYVSATAKEEVKRRKRINAGRYQIISQADQLLPWKRNPWFVWEYLSHKIFRPYAAFALVMILLFNVLAFIFPMAGKTAWVFLPAPLSRILLLCQFLFYTLAFVGNYVPVNNGIAKVLYLPTFFVNSNLAAISGWIGYQQKKQTTLWEKADRKSGKGN